MYSGWAKRILVSSISVTTGPRGVCEGGKEVDRYSSAI